MIVPNVPLALTCCAVADSATTRASAAELLEALAPAWPEADICCIVYMATLAAD